MVVRKPFTMPLPISSKKMGNMGADIFALDWIQATIKNSLPCSAGRSLLPVWWLPFLMWRLSTSMAEQISRPQGVNILKGFFACSLIGVVPVELYKFASACKTPFPTTYRRCLQADDPSILRDKAPAYCRGSFAVATTGELQPVQHSCADRLCLI